MTHLSSGAPDNATTRSLKMYESRRGSSQDVLLDRRTSARRDVDIDVCQQMENGEESLDVSIPSRPAWHM